MKLHHIAIWTFRLEELKEFYVRFLGGKSNETVSYTHLTLPTT